MPPSNIRRITILVEKRKHEKDSTSSLIQKDMPIEAHKKSVVERKTSIEPSKKEFLEYLSNLIDSVEW
jgi:hypothetical protein